MEYLISSFLTGPNDSIQDKIDEIIREHEVLNRKHKAFVKVINSTTDGCAPGTTQHFYSLELIHVDDLKKEEK